IGFGQLESAPASAVVSLGASAAMVASERSSTSATTSSQPASVPWLPVPPPCTAAPPCPPDACKPVAPVSGTSVPPPVVPPAPPPVAPSAPVAPSIHLGWVDSGSPYTEHPVTSVHPDAAMARTKLRT